MIDDVNMLIIKHSVGGGCKVFCKIEEFAGLMNEAGINGLFVTRYSGSLVLPLFKDQASLDFAVKEHWSLLDHWFKEVLWWESMLLDGRGVWISCCGIGI